MKLVAVFAIFASVAIAHPLKDSTNGGGGSVCPPGLFSNALCCATSVLGLIGLDCDVPRHEFHDASDFRNVCAKTGDQALCCVAPLAGQALLCQPVAGAN